VEKVLKQIETFLRGLSWRQRILLGVSAALVGGVIALFVRLSQSADFKPLYSGLAPTDAQAVVQSLVAKNISYQLSTDGTSVSVPADQLDKTRLVLASEGMPQTGRLGFEIFDKPNWAGSDFSEQVNYQRALEGELERTIETLGNVQSVRVHLVLPHDSLFSGRERSAKAAVVMKLRGGGLSGDETNAVTHLVASAVDNLSPENVTLIGADGRTPLVAKGRNGISGQDASVELEAAMAEKLVATLAPVVGPDRVKASVTVAYDQGSGDTTQEIYDPANAALLSSTVQEENFGGSPPAGIPGTPSNVPSAPANAAAGAQTNAPKPAQPPAAANAKPGALPANPPNAILSASTDTEGQHSESRTYAVSKTLRHRIDPSGRIQKVAAAVIVDDVIEQKKDAKGQIQETRRKRTPDEMKQIEALAQAAIGFDATRGDILSVQNISFVNSPSESPEPLPITERVRVVTEKWIWLARYLMMLALFGLIYFLVLRPVKNQLLISFQQPAAEIGSRALAGAMAGSGGTSGLGGTSGAALPQTGGPVSDIELERELSETNSEVERVVKMKRHLVEKVKGEPGAASQLIRHWINEKER
jgi:flagellar M-ring protein FliF